MNNNEKVFISISYLVRELRKAYIASCKALGLANKLKRHRARVLARMNIIRKELNQFEKQIHKGFVAYSGCISNKLYMGF